MSRHENPSPDPTHALFGYSNPSEDGSEIIIVNMKTNQSVDVRVAEEEDMLEQMDTYRDNPDLVQALFAKESEKNEEN